MSQVKVIYYGLIQTTSGNLEDEIYLSDSATVKDLLQLLVERYGNEFRDAILTPEGQIKSTAYIHLNERDINEIDGLNTKLRDNDELFVTDIAFVIDGG